MANEVTACVRCGEPLRPAFANTPGLVPCPACGSPFQLLLFPALLRGNGAGEAGETLVDESLSSCFYHPGKKAEIACDHCGRLVCGLCAIELEDARLCPACVGSGVRKGRIARLDTQCYRYDLLAENMAVWPMLLTLVCFPYLMVFTAPATLYVVWRYWNATTSPIARPRWRMVAAAALAILQLGLIVAGAAWLVFGFLALAEI